MKKIFTKGVAIVIMIVTLNLNSAAQESNPRQYFLNRDYSAQLENYLGTQSLVFEFPGKSANELYSASLEILRGYTGNVELVGKRFIDTYNKRKVQNMPNLKLFYTYMVECEDEKIIIENPIISTEFEEAISGVELQVFPVSGFFELMDQFSARDRAKKLKIQRDELRTALKNSMREEHDRLVEDLNNLTDSLLNRITEGRKINTPDWIPDSYAPTFSLDSAYLKLSNNRNYMVIKNPNITSDEQKEKTQMLLNFLDMNFAAEYSREIIGNRYSFYARRNIPYFIVDAFWGDDDILNNRQFKTIYNFDDFIKLSGSNYLTTIDKQLKGFAVDYEFEISYAPGLIQISPPVLKDYVINPKKKIYIESYFNDLYKLLFKYYSTDFEN